MRIKVILEEGNKIPKSLEFNELETLLLYIQTNGPFVISSKMISYRETKLTKKL